MQYSLDNQPIKNTRLEDVCIQHKLKYNYRPSLLTLEDKRQGAAIMYGLLGNRARFGGWDWMK